MPSKKTAGSADSPNSIRRYQSLDAVRARIDEVDAELSNLLAQRLALTSEVAALKAELKIGIKDGAREREILSRVAESASSKPIAAAIQQVYETIFACSRQLQRTDAIARAAAQEPLYFPRVTIIGLGLIGGSMSRLIKNAIPTTTIVGCDPCAEASSAALEAGAIDMIEQDLRRAVQKSALVILAADPETNVQLISELAPIMRKRQIVIDVSSIKSKIVHFSDDTRMNCDFIGGHPLFGSEKSGFAASQLVQADGAVFCLTPGTRSSEISLRRVIRWLNALSLNVHVLDASTHDAIIARTSHCVQMLALTVASQLQELCNDTDDEAVVSMCGPAIRQFARLWNSPAQMWSQIARGNKEELARALGDLSERLRHLSVAVADNDQETLLSAFERARKMSALLQRSQRD